MSCKSVLSLLGAVFLLLGCEGFIQREIPPFEVNADLIGETSTTRTASRDGYGQTEVLSASGDQGWLSVALISTSEMGIISTEGEAPRLTLNGWTALKGKPLVFGKSVRFGILIGVTVYEFFSFDGNKCFHFHKMNHRSMNDSRGRFRRVLEGYVCSRKGTDWTDEAVTTFLNGISVPPLWVTVYAKDASPVTLFEPVRPVRKPKISEGGCQDDAKC